MPIAVVGESALDAVMKYDHASNKNSKLKEIHIVDINTDNIQAFIRTFQAKIKQASDKSTFQPGSEMHTASISGPLTHTAESSPPEEDICVICMDVLKQPVQLHCKHRFCAGCYHTYSRMSAGPKCPQCNQVFGAQKGNQPDGTMSVSHKRSRLPGHNNCGTIVIDYAFPSGKQEVIIYYRLLYLHNKHIETNFKIGLCLNSFKRIKLNQVILLWGNLFRLEYVLD